MVKTFATIDWQEIVYQKRGTLGFNHLSQGEALAISQDNVGVSSGLVSSSSFEDASLRIARIRQNDYRPTIYLERVGMDIK